MALPRIDVPTYELVVPSTDEKVKYRPFLVKEEKLLLIAMESGKNEDILLLPETDDILFSRLLMVRPTHILVHLFLVTP